jgi:hypothetical protein
MTKELSENELGAHVPALLEPLRPDGWFKAKCTYSNGVVAGYLAESQNDYVWLADTFDHGYWVNWYIHTDGNWYLRLKGTGTSQSANRYLGRAGQDYADWGLWQAPGQQEYLEPVIYNLDHTICRKAAPTQLLYGPYGNKWVCFGEKQTNTLFVTLE